MNQPQKDETAELTKDEQIFAQILILSNLKNQEDALKEQRVKIEERIIDLVGVKEEGAQTYKTESLPENLKITTTGNIARRVDKALLEAKWSKLSEEAANCFQFKPEVKASNFKAAKANPKIMQEIAEIVTEKSNKPSLKIEAIPAK